MRRFSVLSVGAIVAVGLMVSGVSASAGAAHTPPPPVPTVKSVVPDHGSTNGGTTVIIKGKNLFTATEVHFGSATASFTFKSKTSIMATSPAESPGTVQITVTNPAGTSALNAPADDFTYAVTPTIQSLSPKSGATIGGNKIGIIGSDLTGVTDVEFGSTPATSFVINSDQSITAISPAEPVGKVDVTVTGPDGTSPVDPADVYTYALRVPKVTSVLPNTGPEAGGTTVTITGSGFTKVSAVTFGSTPAASFTVNSGKQITATSPPGTGVVDVTVTNFKGTSITSPPDQFTYTSGS